MTKLKKAEIISTQPMRAKINRLHPEIDTWGDCATWAILLASQESKSCLSYPDLVEDIVQLKDDYKANYPYLNESWLKSHAGLQPELTKILLERYFDEPFMQMMVIGRYSLGKLADHLYEVPIVLIGSHSHVTLAAAGKIYDDGRFPRNYRPLYLLVRQQDALTTLQILRKLGEQYPMPDIFPKRSLTGVEVFALKRIQKWIDRKIFYRKAIWGLKVFEGIIALEDLTLLIQQEMLDQDFTWTASSDELLSEVIKNLESMGVVQFKKNNPKEGLRSIICQTDLTISIFHRLSFD